jgi:hypothetical protein
MKKCWMVQNVESKIEKKNIYKYFWLFITTKWLHWYYYILTDNHYSKKYITPSIWHFVIRRFVPFDIISIQHFVPFNIISIRHFVPFNICPIRPLLLSTLCLFGVLSHLTFCPFDMLYHLTFCHSALCPIWRFVVRRLVISAFVTSTFCRWTLNVYDKNSHGTEGVSSSLPWSDSSRNRFF